MSNNIIYTKHVISRASQRNIHKQQIEQTVTKPDRIALSFKGRSCAQKKFGSRALEVIYRKLNGEIVIITAYWLKEV